MSLTRRIINDIKIEAPLLPKATFQSIITSPPYWRCRDYGGGSGQVGWEASVIEYVQALTKIFADLRVALKDDGCVWLNLGDRTVDKQLQGIPWRVAFALQADGWILRSDVIWHKPNATPSSIGDRPTPDHEYLFLLTKRPRYYFNMDAVREPHRMRPQRRRTPHRKVTFDRGERREDLASVRAEPGFDGHPLGRAVRTVWTIPTAPTHKGHPAPFPADLAQRCILASSRSGDTILDPFCGSGTVLEVATRLGRLALGIDLVDFQAKS